MTAKAPPLPFAAARLPIPVLTTASIRPAASASINDVTKDDELLRTDGKTYALAKMWGRQGPAEADRIVGQFDMGDVSYEAID